MTGRFDPHFANSPEFRAEQEQRNERIRKMPWLNPVRRPVGSNADEWHLFLSEHLDNRATSPSGLTYMAVQIAEAIDAALSAAPAASGVDKQERKA